MRGAELYRDFVPQSEDFCTSSNRSYWTFEGDPKRDKERLGGLPFCDLLPAALSGDGSRWGLQNGARTQRRRQCQIVKNCPGQAQNKKTDVRCQKSDVRFFCFLCSVFCFLSSALVCDQNLNYLNFFEGGLSCLKN